jgi:tubulin polyglutamylase TTLL11
MLLDGKKFDLRLYVLIVGFDPIKVYLADEGLARLCTQDYKKPTAANLKNMFVHLTNFSLNKESDKYKAPTEDFLTDDSGSKRLLTSAWKVLEEAGHDVEEIKEKIKDTVRKSVITMEPYLLQTYHQRVSKKHDKAKCFQILGMDILIDKKNRAWLMEINANPSLNMFLEKEADLLPGQEPERILSELDRYVKGKVIGDACRIVGNQSGCEDFDNTFEELSGLDEFGVWNRATRLFELMAAAGKEPDHVTKE